MYQQRRIRISRKVPTILINDESEEISYNAFQSQYEKMQLVLIRYAKSHKEKDPTQLVRDCFKLSSKEVQASWCMENANASKTKRDPLDFMKCDTSNDAWYGSFVFKSEDESASEAVLNKLPIPRLPIQDDQESPLIYGKAVWFFIGQNPSISQGYWGRPLHTDDVPQDATWHFQLSGCKYWTIKPTVELQNLCDLDPSLSLEIPCEQGNILVLNTRLWWHQTFLPLDSNTPCISYARDLFMDKNQARDTDMVNCDGLYAANFIESGTIVFRESEMPNCELPRVHSSPNCEIIELDNGEMALVTVKNIQQGEWFNIIASDDEDDDGDSEAS